MTLFLGIDGGGTGCRAALADAEGHVLGRGHGGPANINTDVDGAAANILAATSRAVADIGTDPRDLIATLGLAGGTITAATNRLTELLPFARVQIVNDAITATRGALGADDGILAALGTGSVFAVQRAGKVRQVGGRGFLLGDEGSGAVMGRELLADAMRAGDGFLPMTPLLQDLLDEYGGAEGIISFGNRASPAQFGELAPRIVNSGDQAANRIFTRAVEEIRHILTVLQDGDNMPVVFVGGLGSHYAARLNAPWPVQAARGDSVDGALLMARQMAGAA
ncbi:BadF/BadG/BcrA/BcrD ATPase family protein [Paracoccus onubensis]|uniref:BadF/BadG/BcrA/BcrD ATPase family protein n=1 Tax=Paracoccus onubensis TaxID=1675788 RepID=UPI00272F6F32|nr:BadF/BadG/BcrA/BcrD ATPase family protein [Paracoccus onubensis]MDP0928950.1 BadF/BadG/BcrA/BcrD ATPase family protein [Paracoccus onubensis]